MSCGLCVVLRVACCVLCDVLCIVYCVSCVECYVMRPVRRVLCVCGLFVVWLSVCVVRCMLCAVLCVRLSCAA